MREIKFRGKRVDNGEWVYGDLVTDGVKSPNKDLAWIFPEDAKEYSFDLLIQVSKKTVGQYTGLTDKKGVEIYEGDKYDNIENNGSYFLVEYSLAKGCLHVNKYGYLMDYNKGMEELFSDEIELIDSDCMGIPKLTFLEVIGNIHD